MIPRQPPKTASTSRSPPPPSPPHPTPPAASRPNPNPVRKIVRLPTRASATGSSGVGTSNNNNNTPATRSFGAARGGGTGFRLSATPPRKRPSPSPPQGTGRAVTPPESAAPATTNAPRSSYTWQRDGAPAAPPPSGSGGALGWKRRRQGDEKADPKTEAAQVPPAQVTAEAVAAPPQEVIKAKVAPPPEEAAPEPSDKKAATLPPDEAKSLEQPSISPAGERAEALVTTPEANTPVEAEMTEEAQADQAAETEDSAFERAMAESEEMMRKSTAWIGEALRSISTDIAKAAESPANRGQLGALLRLSMAELFEPASRYAEAMGGAAAAMEEALAQSKSEEPMMPS